MITLSLSFQISSQDRLILDELIAQQSSVIRQSYCLVKDGMKEKDIRAELKNRNLGYWVDSWFVQSAIKKAKEFDENDKSLNLKKRIFGGKKNFYDRSSGKITSDEFKRRRLIPLYLVGEAPQGGNRKAKFEEDKIVLKPKKGAKLELLLPNMKKNYRRTYQKLIKSAEDKKQAITITITKDDHICLSFDETLLFDKKDRKVIPNRYAALDMNPRDIGVSVFDYDPVTKTHNLVITRMYDLTDLVKKKKFRTNDREKAVKVNKYNHAKCRHETIEMGHDLGRWLEHLQVEDVFIEDLKFKSGSMGNRYLNREIKGFWKKGAFVSALKKHFKIKEVNPAYTSTIGNIINSSYPDPIASSMEIGRRGKDMMVYPRGTFYPAMISHEELQNLWKEEVVPQVKSWIELHNWIKNSGVRYRVPVPKDQEFRTMKSSKSRVLVTTFV